MLHPYRPSFCSCGGRGGRHCLVLFVLECCSVSWVKLAARNENKHIRLAFFLEYRHQLQSLYGGKKRQRKGKLALFVTAVAVKQRIVFFLPHKTAACLKIAYCSTCAQTEGEAVNIRNWKQVTLCQSCDMLGGLRRILLVSRVKIRVVGYYSPLIFDRKWPLCAALLTLMEAKPKLIWIVYHSLEILDMLSV